MNFTRTFRSPENIWWLPKYISAQHDYTSTYMGTEFIYFEMFMWIMCDTHIHIIVKQKEKNERDREKKRKSGRYRMTKIGEEETSCGLVWRVSRKKVLSLLEDMIKEPLKFVRVEENGANIFQWEAKKKIIKMEKFSIIPYSFSHSLLFPSLKKRKLFYINKRKSRKNLNMQLLAIFKIFHERITFIFLFAYHFPCIPF